MGTVYAKHQEEEERTPCQEPSLDALEVLSDSKNRSILTEMRGSEDRLTTKEISEKCDIPLSTVYRKIDALLNASLIEESMELRKGCKHTHAYELRFEGIEVSVTEDGIDTEVSRSEKGGAASRQFS